MKSPLTVNADERARVARLRHFVPDVPEGWVQSPAFIQRINSESADGVFCQRFKKDKLMLAFIVLPPEDRVQVSVSYEGGTASDSDIDALCSEWFPGRHTVRTDPLDGIRFLRIGDLLT